MTGTRNFDLLGESVQMRRLKDLITKVGRRKEPVLIQGPTGSGKELVARALHMTSGRRGAFVAFNVCAIPDTMFEDSLFGHVRGAFTGASTDSVGYLAEANDGTAFFDELSGLGVGAQAKLLRAIETGEFRPVGARADRRSDFRVVASVNEPIDQLVKESRLRRDLLHRLSTFVLEVPPLNERREDIALLAAVFARLASDNASSPIALSDCAIRVLKSYDWPGNVRQLKNVVVRVVALAERSIVTSHDVLPLLKLRPSDEGITRESDEKQKLLDLLVAASWDTSIVSRQLGVDRATVYRRMATFGIERGRAHRQAQTGGSQEWREPTPKNAIVDSPLAQREGDLSAGPGLHSTIL